MNEHLSELGKTDPRLQKVLSAIGPLNFRRRHGGFEGLLRLIVEQQLSVKAADSIWQKLKSGLNTSEPHSVLALNEDELRKFGLSRPKARYAHILAEATMNQHIDFEQLQGLETEVAIDHLTSLKGIGRWSAEVYLMFCEGRLDLFPTGDIALREALGWLDALPSRPDEAYCKIRSETWKPLRSVAAHALWRWYGMVKRSELEPLSF
jgi:DNA-3-methyladenine glycosylase II